MKKVKSFLFAFAFIIALGGAFAFNMPGKQANTVFHYDSDSYVLEDMQNIENWKESGPSCDNNGDLPCSIDFDGDEVDFAAFLSVSDEEDILTRAEGKRTVIP